MIIRVMSEADALPVSEIVSTDYRLLAERDGFTAEQLHRLLAERCSAAYLREGWLTRWDCFVVEAETGIVGAVAIAGNEIAELWVIPACHRRGIGSMLFRYAEQRMREAGHRLLTLHCATLSAKPFYTAMGMTIEGSQPCTNGPLQGHPITCYRKKLELAPAQHA